MEFPLGILKKCVLRNNLGAGKFGSPKNLPEINNLGDRTTSKLYATDLNKDGNIDLVSILLNKSLAGSTSHEQLVVFPGDGKSSFGSPQVIADFGSGALTWQRFCASPQ